MVCEKALMLGRTFPLDTSAGFGKRASMRFRAPPLPLPVVGRGLSTTFLRAPCLCRTLKGWRAGGHLEQGFPCHACPASTCQVAARRRPMPTGSSPAMNTIGIVDVAPFAATAASGVPAPTIMATRRDTRSAASAGTRSKRRSAQRIRWRPRRNSATLHRRSAPCTGRRVRCSFNSGQLLHRGN
jgi:hypothetical protein